MRQALESQDFKDVEEIALHIIDWTGNKVTDKVVQVEDWPDVSDDVWLNLDQDTRRSLMAFAIYGLANVRNQNV